MKPENPKAFACASELGHQSGMELRDYFAAKAMQAVLTGHKRYIDEVAEEAYAVADAMLKAR